MVKLDRCNSSSNTLDDPSGRICILNEVGNVKMNKKK